ncbi:hypothetical protein SAMD00019534_063760, partial [Acytostelium subglobosum LB1]|uniref:hypothetical protein n=1 Tax=Acytostelium subglobosum LB1 TaxID=1410327 RepID=UPI00064521FC
SDLQMIGRLLPYINAHCKAVSLHGIIANAEDKFYELLRQITVPIQEYHLNPDLVPNGIATDQTTRPLMLESLYTQRQLKSLQCYYSLGVSAFYERLPRTLTSFQFNAQYLNMPNNLTEFMKQCTALDTLDLRITGPFDVEWAIPDLFEYLVENKTITNLTLNCPNVDSVLGCLRLNTTLLKLRMYQQFGNDQTLLLPKYQHEQTSNNIVNYTIQSLLLDTKRLSTVACNSPTDYFAGLHHLEIHLSSYYRDWIDTRLGQCQTLRTIKFGQGTNSTILLNAVEKLATCGSLSMISFGYLSFEAKDMADNIVKCLDQCNSVSIIRIDESSLSNERLINAMRSSKVYKFHKRRQDIQYHHVYERKIILT